MRYCVTEKLQNTLCKISSFFVIFMTLIYAKINNYKGMKIFFMGENAQLNRCCQGVLRNIIIIYYRISHSVNGLHTKTVSC
jgi:hypothetical protein